MVPPLLTVAVAVAVVNPLPSGGDENLTVGSPVYPKPILVKSTDDTVPVSDIIAVANPTSIVFWDAISTKFWVSALLVGSSLFGLKNGTALLTLNIVAPALTELIR